MRADRLLSILLILQNRGRLTARELAEELEVSERTIYRDLDALSTAGVPVYCERGPGGGCALLDSYRTNLTGLTRDEVRALFMLNIPAALQQLGVDQDLRAALLKVSAALPEILRPEGSRARARIHLDSSPPFQQEQVTTHLATLQRALWADRCLELTYRLAFGAQVQHLVAPYGLVAKLDLWHLVFYREESIFVLPVSDILDARLTELTFSMPPGFNLVEFWQQWSAQYEHNLPQYQVLVRLSPQSFAMLEYFKDPVLPGERVPPEQEEDGWYRLKLKFDTFENTRKWLLNHGGGVEILAPQAMRASVQDFARQTLAVYQPETYG